VPFASPGLDRTLFEKDIMGLLQNLVELSNGPSCFFREKKVSA